MTMRKILICIAACFLSFHLFAQTVDDPQRRTTFGVYAGGNVSQLLTDSVSDTKARIGYQYGAFLRYGGSLFVRGDIALHSMSSQLVDAADTATIIGGTGELEDKIDIQYIHVPVQIGYKLISSPDGTSAVWIAAGAYFDQIYKVKTNDLLLTKEDFNTSSFGVMGTAGLDLWVLTFQLGYHYGLTPIFKNDDQSMKYSLVFSAGIKF